MAAIDTFEIPDGTLGFSEGPLTIKFFSIEGRGCGEAGEDEDNQGIVDATESS